MHRQQTTTTTAGRREKFKPSPQGGGLRGGLLGLPKSSPTTLGKRKGL